jgi:hypothetical protein
MNELVEALETDSHLVAQPVGVAVILLEQGKLWQGALHKEHAELAAKELFVVLDEQAQDTTLQKMRPCDGIRCRGSLSRDCIVCVSSDTPHG